MDGTQGSESSAYFAAESHQGTEVLVPLPHAASRWNEDQVRGPALAGILARAAEGLFAERPDLWAARSTFEFFSPVRMAPSETTATFVRKNRRLAVVESLLLQSGRPVASAQILLLAPSQNPEGALGATRESLPPPPPGLEPDTEGRLYRLGDGAWCSEEGILRRPGRKQVWQTPTPIVHGEVPSGFQLLAAVSDLTNLVAHVSDLGIQYINADSTIVATRPPQGEGLGLARMLQMAEAGISTGTGVVFDSAGVFATTSVTSLANGRRTVPIGESSTT